MYTPDEIMANYWTEGIVGLPYAVQDPIDELMIDINN